MIHLNRRLDITIYLSSTYLKTKLYSIKLEIKLFKLILFDEIILDAYCNVFIDFWSKITILIEIQQILKWTQPVYVHPLRAKNKRSWIQILLNISKSFSLADFPPLENSD